MEKFVKTMAMGTMLSAMPMMSFATNSDFLNPAFDSRPAFPSLEMMQGDWTWTNVAKIPNVDNLQPDPEKKGRYMMYVTLAEDNPQHSVVFYGTKQKPEFAVIESYAWGMVNVQEGIFIKLNRLRGNQALKSNCNFKEMSYTKKEYDKEVGQAYEISYGLDFQQVYQLPKAIHNLREAKQPLYMSTMQQSSYFTTSTFQTHGFTRAIITPNKQKLGVYMAEFGWNRNKQGKVIKCTVS